MPSSSHCHGLATSSDLSVRAYCLGVALPHLSGRIEQWHHPTVTAQWLDQVTPGRIGDSRTEARSVHSFIYLFTRKTASTPSWPGQEESVSLQDLLVQSSDWFGICSLQFGSLGTSLESSFSYVRGTGAKRLRSVRSVRLIQFSYGLF